MATKKGEYSIIELKFNSAEQPKYSEKKGSGGMINYGERNNYPNYLNRLDRESPKHGAILKGKSTYIFGKGLSNPETLPQLKGDSWNNLLKKCISDDEKFGGYYLQIIWNSLGQVASIYHLKFHKVRTNQDNSKFWVKDEWDTTKQLTAKDKAKEREYEGFNTNNRQGTQILFVKQDGGENDVYPLPSYFQALNYIESDIEVSRHILGMAQSGFVGSKLINFNNGEPGEEAKREIEKRVGEKFTGSSGKRFMLAFNKNAAESVTVQDLGTSDLTKEDFTNVNNLIQQEIFAGHQITSPILFGIKTEGQLGGRTEMRDAYEIFKNTYVNERQQAHEEVFNTLIQLAGGSEKRLIIPVEPLQVEFTESTIVQNMTKEEIRERLGLPPLEVAPSATGIIDGINSLPPLVANKVLESMEPNEIRALVGLVPKAGGSLPIAPTDAEGNEIVSQAGMVNDNIKNLTGKQHQQLTRIIRQYSKGQLTLEAATALLRAGLGLNPEEISSLLGVGEQAEQTAMMKFTTDAVLQQFQTVGQSRNSFVVVKQIPFDKDLNKEMFAAADVLSVLDSKILELISRDSKITADVIAKAVKTEVAIVSKIIKELETANYLRPTITRQGTDEIIERELTQPLSEITKQKPSTTDILLRYSYEGPKDSRNRPFCARLMELDKFYSRSDIERISERLGYSVWDRRGGWWTMPDGEHSPSCRHSWVANIVLKK
jgi:hypothetical protein